MIRALLVGVAILLSACGPQTAGPDPVPTPPPVPSGLLSNSQFPLDVSLDPPCVAQGEPIAATAKTTPGATLDFVATYPSGGSDPDTKQITANAKGRATWEWPIPAQATSGPGALITQASRDGKESKYVSPFRIDPACTR